MSSDTYFGWVRRHSPEPTDTQCRNFALRLAEDHSWYKHLPLEGPGEPFFVYLDPNIQQVFVPAAGGGGGTWREVVRRGVAGLTVDRQPGDESAGGDDREDYMVGHDLGRETTSEYRREYGYWAYWNFGAPGQDRETAIAGASSGLVLADDRGEDVRIPADILRVGLVYLRATISPFLSYEAATYEQLRDLRGLPSHEEDRRAQLDALLQAMFSVRHLVFGGPMVEVVPGEVDWDEDDDWDDDR